MGQLRFLGEEPVRFWDVPGVIEPGGEFEVPDEQEERYLRRDDVEKVEAGQEPRSVARRKAVVNDASTSATSSTSSTSATDQDSEAQATTEGTES